MHPTIKIIMWMSVFLLFFSIENVYSQEDMLDCSTPDTCSEPWEEKSFIGNLGSGITALIYYKVRDCQHPQFMVDSIIALDNGRFLDSLNRYQFSYSAFSDLVDIYLLQHYYETRIPYFDHPDSSTCVLKFYKASCGIFLKCTYRVITDFNVECDSGYDPPFPLNLNQGTKDLNIYKWHPCGKV